MANVIVTLRIMPEGPDTNLDAIQKLAEERIIGYAGDGDRKAELEPIAFGLKALRITFVSDEAKGTTDDLEEQIAKLEGVKGVEVVDVRRAVG